MLDGGERKSEPSPPRELWDQLLTSFRAINGLQELEGIGFGFVVRRSAKQEDTGTRLEQVHGFWPADTLEPFLVVEKGLHFVPDDDAFVEQIAEQFEFQTGAIGCQK